MDLRDAWFSNILDDVGRHQIHRNHYQSVEYLR
uniref:Uncharacterized protein n=1 Tax=Moniliophthora roreri TaxID=221103 RepID=A0A0W0G032_MONRR